MSNIFINRNRSQGNYGSKNNQNAANLSKTQLMPPQETDFKWRARSKLVNDDFFRRSLKYGSNIDLCKTDKAPGAGWSLIDTTKNVTKTNEADFIANNYDKHRNRTKSNAVTQQWKSFNTYEKEDHQRNIKLVLRDEINNIAMRIVNAREAKQNCSDATREMISSWKPATIEPMAKNFMESSRYFDVFPQQRHYGKMHVKPPVVAETLQQLQEDQQAFEFLQKPNYLINQKYQDTKSQTLKNTDRADIMSLLSGHQAKYVPNRTPTVQRRSNHANMDANSESRNNAQKGKQTHRQLSVKSDVESMKLAKRMLKFSQVKGGFQFPKRERFNEEADEEIKSQISDQKQRLTSGHALKKRFLRNNLNTTGDSENGSAYAASNADGSIVSGARSKISKVTSKMSSRKAFSKTSGHVFNRGKSAYKPNQKNSDLVSETKSRGHKRSTLIGNSGTKSTKDGLQRGADLGNPRYKADKAPSQVGLLIGTCQKQNKDTALSTFASRNRNSDDGLENENDPYIREQDHYFEDEVGQNGELNKRALRTLNHLNHGSDNESEPGNVEEITFHDFDGETMDQRTLILDDDGESGIGEPVGHQRTFSLENSQLQVNTWGTNGTPAMKNRIQTPSEKIRNRQYIDDRMTQVSSIYTNLSGAPSSHISRQCQKLQNRLAQQKQNRAFLQKQIEQLQDQCVTNSTFIQMQQNGDFEQKMMVTDQRNQMYSAENYLRHPQVEDL